MRLLSSYLKAFCWLRLHNPICRKHHPVFDYFPLRNCFGIRYKVEYCKKCKKVLGVEPLQLDNPRFAIKLSQKVYRRYSRYYVVLDFDPCLKKVEV